MAATNIPWSLDSAILRRFDKKIYISLPEPDAREYLVWKKLKGLSDELSDSDFKLIAQRTENYSGSDLEALCSDVAM